MNARRLSTGKVERCRIFAAKLLEEDVATLIHKTGKLFFEKAANERAAITSGTMCVQRFEY